MVQSIFHEGAKEPHNGRIFSSTNDVGKTGHPPLRLKLDPYLIALTNKLNKLDLNIKSETVQFLKKTIGWRILQKAILCFEIIV